ncbi:hypothetical protein V2G26_007288 [Clonostachys chloroleuca]
MASLLRDKRVMEFDILAIQEPWRNPYIETTHHPAKEAFHLCYLSGNSEPARTCFFVNKRLDHTKWQFKPHTRDICTITVEAGDGFPIHVHNVYNAGPNAENKHSALLQMRQILNEHEECEQIVVGDFNLHHAFWGGPTVEHADPEANQLIELIEDFDLTSTLQPGTITYEEGERQSTIDLCLVTLGLVDRLIRKTGG